MLRKNDPRSDDLQSRLEIKQRPDVEDSCDNERKFRDKRVEFKYRAASSTFVHSTFVRSISYIFPTFYFIYCI